MASKANAKFSSTEEDFYRNQASESLFNKTFFDEFGKRNYEYTMNENTIDRQKHDPQFVERAKLMKHQKGIVKSNEILFDILNRRELTSDEMRRKQELDQKLANDTIKDNEEAELAALKRIGLFSSKDKNAKITFNGLNGFHYYVGARKNLKQGCSFSETDGTQTRSLEQPLPAEINEKQRCVTFVVEGDLIGEENIQREKGLNPLIVCWGSRMACGGNWDKGCIGTEEELFLRSSCSIAFTDRVVVGYYPMQDDAVLLARKVFIYREPYSKEFKTMDSAKLTFVSLALCSTEYLSAENKELSEDQGEMLKAKLRNVLQTALYWGYDSIVMNLIGIGAPYNYPAEATAAIYKHVMFGEKAQFFRKFKRITFVTTDRATDAKILETLNKADKEAKIKEINHRRHAFEVYKRELSGMTHKT